MVVGVRTQAVENRVRRRQRLLEAEQVGTVRPVAARSTTLMHAAHV
jgi:hypothetical protein